MAAAVLAIAARGSPASSTSSPLAAGASSPAASSSGTSLMSTTISGTKVLTNPAGFTLYWFAPGTPPTPSAAAVASLP